MIPRWLWIAGGSLWLRLRIVDVGLVVVVAGGGAEI